MYITISHVFCWYRLISFYRVSCFSSQILAVKYVMSMKTLSLQGDAKSSFIKEKVVAFEKLNKQHVSCKSYPRMFPEMEKHKRVRAMLMSFFPSSGKICAKFYGVLSQKWGMLQFRGFIVIFLAFYYLWRFMVLFGTVMALYGTF